MSRAPVLLVIDDERNILELIERIVRPLGFTTVLHDKAGEAMARLPTERPDIALVDLHMPGTGGLDVLRMIRRVRPECAVILMTGQASADTAIEAVKLGALDYLAKPLDIERLRQRLADAREEAGRRAAILESDTTAARRLELCGMVGRSAIMQELFGLMRRIAPHARSALITGETGVGKEAVAHAIHALGPRAQKPLATINCSVVIPSLFESELFGHMGGSFTGAESHKPGIFESADGGTLFLDEIGELPLAVQARLLRVLETGAVQRVGALHGRHVDVRILAATSRDLRAEANAGRFRSDLFQLLTVIQLHVPPLRERREDIPYLTAAFVKAFAARLGKTLGGVSAGAERRLMSADWHGNVRELRNVLERACTLADGEMLTERDVAGAMPSEPVQTRAATRAAATDTHTDLACVEREHIAKVLAEAHGNKVVAARRLGISRRTLYRRLEHHGLLSTLPGRTR